MEINTFRCKFASYNRINNPLKVAVMDKKFVDYYKEQLEKYKDVIKDVISTHLGISSDFRINERSYRHSGSEVHITLEEVGNESTSVLTSHKLLAQLFKSSKVEIVCWYWDDVDTGAFNVNIFYDHNYRSGSNGHEIMMFTIDFKSGEVKVKK